MITLKSDKIKVSKDLGFQVSVCKTFSVSIQTMWDGADCALRDYFLARSEQFGLLWIYRERLSTELAGSESSWYLHGLFA